MSNLAVTLQGAGDLTGARMLQARVLAIQRRVLGAEHLDTLQSMNNLAEDLRGLGDLATACSLNEETLDTRRRVLGPEHPNTLESMEQLGGCVKRPRLPRGGT